MLKHHEGFTLIESLLYIALFSVIMASVGLSVFYIIEAGDKAQAKSFLEEEANFVYAKINYAMTGAVSISEPTAGTTSSHLTFALHDGTTYNFALDAGRIEIQKDVGSYEALSAGFFSFSNLSFDYDETSGKVLTTTFDIKDNFGNSQTYSFSRSIRQ